MDAGGHKVQLRPPFVVEDSDEVGVFFLEVNEEEVCGPIDEPVCPDRRPLVPQHGLPFNATSKARVTGEVAIGRGRVRAEFDAPNKGNFEPLQQRYRQCQ
jgi:hypothetical protein